MIAWSIKFYHRELKYQLTNMSKKRVELRIDHGEYYKFLNVAHEGMAYEHGNVKIDGCG